jgi:hypothetical protein
VVTFALLLAFLQQPSLEFQRSGEAWTLLRDGKVVTELPDADVRVVDVFGERWQSRIDAVRRAAGDSTDKQLYIAFLKQWHGYQIAAVNEAYGLEASAFTDLESPDAFAKARRNEADDRAFAAEYFAGAVEGRAAWVLLRPDVPAEIAVAVVRKAQAVVVRDLVPGLERLGKPILYRTAGECPAVRPAYLAACIRISKP